MNGDPRAGVGSYGGNGAVEVLLVAVDDDREDVLVDRDQDRGAELVDELLEADVDVAIAAPIGPAPVATSCSIEPSRGPDRVEKTPG